MAYETILVETRGKVGLITLNRPQALNALNSTLLGEVNQLRQVAVGSISAARFLDPAAATYRWGAGHSHGAILLTSSESVQQ